MQAVRPSGTITRGVMVKDKSKNKKAENQQFIVYHCELLIIKSPEGII
ncbi:hypothetical protein COPEUT_01445 [Coprococcus eutactus ATCC 27759]|nr:hypothetical protein COPEUT_01445 [Coprococcus eutactus ATCC 27759]